MVEVIDNFLPENVFRQVQQTLMSDGFPWYFNDGIIYRGERGKYQFTHSFFTQDGLKHDYYNSIEPCLRELGATTLLRVKANLNPKTLFCFVSMLFILIICEIIDLYMSSDKFSFCAYV